ATHGGRKHPVRMLDASGTAVSETVHVGAEAPAASGGRVLHVPLVVDGDPVEGMLGVAGVEAARVHRAATVAELPAEAFRLAAGEPAIPTVYVEG
ncbi:MAG: nicotinate phosphoribosyltransferase, partial [Herbiconiux sp.]|nr:nicotinate phosphoribosyltransferase [Herbiconiux sp.]